MDSSKEINQITLADYSPEKAGVGGSTPSANSGASRSRFRSHSEHPFRNEADYDSGMKPITDSDFKPITLRQVVGNADRDHFGEISTGRRWTTTRALQRNSFRHRQALLVFPSARDNPLYYARERQAVNNLPHVANDRIVRGTHGADWLTGLRYDHHFFWARQKLHACLPISGLPASSPVVVSVAAPATPKYLSFANRS